MPNIKSAKKRVIVNDKKNLQNRMVLTQVKNAIKAYYNLLDTNKIEEAEKALPSTMSVIDSACSKGLIHKNNAANKKSAMAKKLSDIKSGKLEVTIKKDNKTIAAEKAKAAQAARDAQRAENAKLKAEKQAEKKAADEKKAKEEAPKKAPAKKKATKTEEKEEAPKKAPAKKKAAPKAKKEADAEKAE